MFAESSISVALCPGRQQRRPISARYAALSEEAQFGRELVTQRRDGRRTAACVTRKALRNYFVTTGHLA
jgi:hypothetical protein